MKHESDGDTNCNWCSWYSHKRISTGIGRLGNKRTSGDHPKYDIIRVSQNTEKSPGDLRRLTVIQTPLENHRLTPKKEEEEEEEEGGGGGGGGDHHGIKRTEKQ